MADQRDGSELSWKRQAEAELAHARQARAVGNEGMTRVCARRAAGHIIAYYYALTGNEDSFERNALALLQRLERDDQVSAETRRIAGHFTLKVTLDHELPVEADLIAEVGWLAKTLLGEEL